VLADDLLAVAVCLGDTLGRVRRTLILPNLWWQLGQVK
jgi:hypothetical protein